MKSRLEEYREFFAELLEDLASDEELADGLKSESPEERVRFEHEMNQIEGMLRAHPGELKAESPEQFRQRIAGESAEYLFAVRRMMAKDVCECVVRGHAHRASSQRWLEHSLTRMAACDAEIERRHLGPELDPEDRET